MPRRGRVRITPETLRYRGSGVGLLPRGKLIGVQTMLHGLLLPSGNDAAIALAQRAGGGSVRAFVRLMNRRAAAMGLTCTHFSAPERLPRRRQPLVRRRPRGAGASGAAHAAAGADRAPPPAVLPFPIKGRKLYLYNTNPLLRERYRGTTGVKTGYTVAAGRCLVATARRGQGRLGVVLLHSRDPGRQARRLLDRGFRFARCGRVEGAVAEPAAQPRASTAAGASPAALVVLLAGIGVRGAASPAAARPPRRAAPAAGAAGEAARAAARRAARAAGPAVIVAFYGAPQSRRARRARDRHARQRGAAARAAGARLQRARRPVLPALELIAVIANADAGRGRHVPHPPARRGDRALPARRAAPRRCCCCSTSSPAARTSSPRPRGWSAGCASPTSGSRSTPSGAWPPARCRGR